MIVHDTFARIEHIDDLRDKIADKKEIQIKEVNGFFVASYQVADNTTFDSLEALECRGITFYPDGTIASRPFHKFFNLGEKEETFEENLPTPENVMRVTDKEDGSMIHPVIGRDDMVLFKTKKTFYSDVAIAATNHVLGTFDGKRKTKIQHFCYEMLTLGYTPIFEYVSPANRIVLKYDEEDLCLIAIRENVSGRYFEPHHVNDYAKKYNLSVVGMNNLDIEPWEYNSWKEVKEELQNKENIEGIVVQFYNGEMIKIKTPWYQQLHRAMAYSRERDIAEMVVDETIDDHKAMLHEMGEDLSKVEEIEHDVVEELNDLREHITQTFNKNAHKSRKEFAIKHKGFKTFGLLMTMLDGNEPNLIEFWKKNRLKSYSLETVV